MIDYDSIFKNRFDFKIIFVIIVAALIGIYVVNLMFGQRSFSQMLELKSTQKILKQRVKYLKKENEKLQKEFFELKELEG
jgi:cell division protein FtsB